METLLLPLPAELRQAIRSHGDEPLRLVDEETKKVYVLWEQHICMPVDDDYVRMLLKEADEEIVRGEVAPLDIDEIKARGRQILSKWKDQ